MFDVTCQHCDHEFSASVSDIEGGHRVYCGDATSQDDVQSLLFGECVDLAFTSFPYAVGLDYGETYADSMDSLRSLLRAVPPLVFACLKDGGYFVTNFGDIIGGREYAEVDEPCEYPMGVEYWPAFRHAGFVLHTRRIWAKPHARIAAPWCASSNRAASDWEHIWTWKKPGSGLNERREPSYFGVWDSTRLEGVDVGKSIHPAAFPVGIAALVLRVYTNPGDLVLDPFLGTGTTMIAAEQEGRRCIGMEISPAYCDVIIARFESVTGKKAVRCTA